jgi:hypothetical protein
LGFGFGLFGLACAFALAFGRCLAGAVVVGWVAADVEVVLDAVELPPQPASPRTPRRAKVIAACRQLDMAPTVATTS